MLMTGTVSLQVVPIRLIQVIPITKLLRADICCVQTISDLLEQFVARLLASLTLLQDDNNFFHPCKQLGTSSANTSCLRTHLVDKL